MDLAAQGVVDVRSVFVGSLVTLQADACPSTRLVIQAGAQA